MWQIPARVEERSEGNFEKSVLPFYLMGPWDGAVAVRLGGRCLYLLSHLADPDGATLDCQLDW